MTDTAALRARIKATGLKYNYIAPRTGLSPMGLQRKIENESEFKASEIKILSELLGLTREERDAIFFD